MLDRFGLPQKRERALIIATRGDYRLRSLENSGPALEYGTLRGMFVVQLVISHPSELARPTPTIRCIPVLVSMKPSTVRRLQLLPHDGGSWVDLRQLPEADEVLLPSMKRNIELGRLGSHPDVYGRLWWDRPAVTIKRECSHVGNGRYSHPVQDRLLSVREMAILQAISVGLPIRGFVFVQHVSPHWRCRSTLISYQLVWVAS